DGMISGMAWSGRHGMVARCLNRRDNGGYSSHFVRRCLMSKSVIIANPLRSVGLIYLQLSFKAQSNEGVPRGGGSTSAAAEPVFVYVNIRVNKPSRVF